MKLLSSLMVMTLLGSSLVTSNAQESFQAQFDRLSAPEQAAIRADAMQKEDYDQLPSKLATLNLQSVTDFCKLLPRGLQSVTPNEGANRVGIERERNQLWARYLSCHDSVLYYEGHRFFKSGHYTNTQLSSAISEIKRVMDWLVKQEKELDINQKFTNVR